MKRWLCIFAGLIIMSITAGCGKKDEVSEVTVDQPKAQAEVSLAGDNADEAIQDVATAAVDNADEVLQEVMAPPAGGNEDKKAQEVMAPPAEKSAEGIDVDLTVLSSTMVYSQVFNMMSSPEDFIGKTVKMEGMFSSFHDEETGKTYFACIISDATACCSQGIEFVLTDDYSYPEDYPPEGDDICVEGVFDTYEENGYTYTTLRNARIAG